jgi:hypothetical protein
MLRPSGEGNGRHPRALALAASCTLQWRLKIRDLIQKLGVSSRSEVAAITERELTG